MVSQGVLWVQEWHIHGEEGKITQSSSLPFLNPSVVLSDILAPEVPGGYWGSTVPSYWQAEQTLFIVKAVDGAPWCAGLWWQQLSLVHEHRELWATAGAAPCVHVCVRVQGTGGGYGVKQAWPCRVRFVHDRVWYSQPLAPRGSTHTLFRYPDCVRCPHFLSRRKERIILTVIGTHPLEAHQDPLPAAVAGSRFATSNGVISCLFQIALSFTWLFFAGACSLWDLSSLTRDWTLGHSNSENAES